MNGREYRPTQCERILRVLQSGAARRKGVTIMELQQYLQIGDPRARIRDLREMGYRIDTVNRDKDGKYHAYGRYFLREPEVTQSEARQRVDAAAGTLSDHQIKTLHGQINAGDVQGAMKGLRVLLYRAKK